MKQRLPQLVLIACTLGVYWLGMQVVHEAGHVFGAWFVGARVEHIVLHPFTISRTQLVQLPAPLAVTWSGPIFGMAAPLIWYALWSATRLPGGYLWRCFAGFCLLVNGSYLAAGAIFGVGDSQDLLVAGVGAWRMIAIGILCLPPGLWLFHRQGKFFGLGEAKGHVSIDAAYLMAFLFLAIFIPELAQGGRIDFAG